MNSFINRHVEKSNPSSFFLYEARRAVNLLYNSDDHRQQSLQIRHMKNGKFRHKRSFYKGYDQSVSRSNATASVRMLNDAEVQGLVIAGPHTSQNSGTSKYHR